jgi:RNA polymerase sigma factor (TIGR02999 family)
VTGRVTFAILVLVEGDAVAAAPTSVEVLTALRSGEAESLDSLIPVLYQELRLIAHRHLARRRGNDASGAETTSLVNEVYLKLVDQTQAEWRDRAHFLAVAAIAMRHILINRARARVANKRGGAEATVTLDEEAIAADRTPEALLDLNEALDKLAMLDARLARVVECRFFGGLSEDEIAEALGITVRTVQRDWAKARMLLRRALAE